LALERRRPLNAESLGAVKPAVVIEKMRIFRRTIGLGLAIAALCFVGWYLAGWPSGFIQAKIDISRGVLAHRTYGSPVSWYDQYAVLLADRYKIRLERVAGCIVDDRLVERTRGYNQTMEKRALEKHGKDVFAECRADAQKACGKRN
jgi:hypothetical protein